MNDGHAAEVHIASFVVQHRAEAAAALAQAIARRPGLELSVAGDTRSVVLCESNGRRGVMAHVDELQAMPGVLNVLLVYHHAEPAPDLDLPLIQAPATGVSA